MSAVVVHYSMGIGSWVAASRAIERHGSTAVTLLFADVLMEHADAYRFGIEGAALLRGIPLAGVADLATAASALPPVSDMDARKLALVALRRASMARVPGLVWLADGRSTFEAMRDARFLGNSRLCPAAKLLKHRVLDVWMRAHAPGATVAVGLDWLEMDRIERLARALRTRGGWRLTAPLARRPFLSKTDMIALASAHGLRASDSYALGLAHDNCSGLCVRGGKAHWALVREHRPDVFQYGVGEENGLRELLGDVSILKETVKRQRRLLPLAELDQRLAVRPLNPAEQLEIGGCACGADVYDEAA